MTLQSRAAGFRAALLGPVFIIACGNAAPVWAAEKNEKTRSGIWRQEGFDEFSKILEETNAVANDEQARQLLEDEEAREYLINYGKETYRKFDGIWKERYCERRCGNTDTVKDC